MKQARVLHDWTRTAMTDIHMPDAGAKRTPGSICFRLDSRLEPQQEDEAAEAKLTS
jgi:hypothetical protein